MENFILRKIDDCYNELIPFGAIKNAPMSEHTSFRIGGPADILVSPKSTEDLICCLNCVAKYDLPLFVMGNGSNLLVSDKGIRGVVIKLQSTEPKLNFNHNKLTVSADTLLCVAAKTSVSNGYMGLEWASGIPGTVGGAVSMNAGAYGGEIKDRLVSVKAVCRVENRYELFVFEVEDSDLGYRFSRYAYPDMIVTEASFLLQPDDGGAVERMADFNQRRISKQPLEFPSAGSTFKRPEGTFAGYEIEQAGLKGYCHGGACVSEKHAGFIVNKGNATFNDVVELIDIVKQRVFEHSGITLCEEIKIIGG